MDFTSCYDGLPPFGDVADGESSSNILYPTYLRGGPPPLSAGVQLITLEPDEVVVGGTDKLMLPLMNASHPADELAGGCVDAGFFDLYAQPSVAPSKLDQHQRLSFCPPAADGGQAMRRKHALHHKRGASRKKLRNGHQSARQSGQLQARKRAEKASARCNIKHQDELDVASHTGAQQSGSTTAALADCEAGERLQGDRTCVDPFAPEASVPLPFQIGDEYGYYGPSAIWKRNERERQRVRCVNDAYERLREHLPFFDRERRLSKVDTLRLAISHIRHMQLLLADGPPHEIRCDCYDDVCTAGKSSANEQ